MEMGTIAVSSDANTRTVALLGEHDISTEPELRHNLTAPTGTRIVVDLRAATFIDSMIIRALINAAKDHNVAVILAAGSLPARVWDIVGMPDKIPTYPSRAAELAARSTKTTA